jgi:hypothetical protein
MAQTGETYSSARRFLERTKSSGPSEALARDRGIFSAEVKEASGALCPDVTESGEMEHAFLAPVSGPIPRMRATEFGLGIKNRRNTLASPRTKA